MPTFNQTVSSFQGCSEIATQVALFFNQNIKILNVILAFSSTFNDSVPLPDTILSALIQWHFAIWDIRQTVFHLCFHLEKSLCPLFKKGGGHLLKKTLDKHSVHHIHKTGKSD